MNKFKHKKLKRGIRHSRVRAKLSGTTDRPRLAVYRSGLHIYAQIIDDVTGKTLFSASDLDVKTGQKSERAAQVGKRIAQQAKTAGVAKVSFDRGGFKYHGRIKALAEAAREAGLEF